jgi:transcriptional regulator with XRE-family HTH domain
MPRQNQPRSIAGEQSLARRIAYERESRGMSYEGLAVQMKHQGCPVNASALFRIEKGEPPRRITVDEFIGFSRVFGVPIERLLLPPEIAAREELADLAVAWNTAQMAAWTASAEADQAWDAMRTFVQEHPEVRDAVESVISAWVAELWPEGERPGQFAYRMQQLTGDSSYTLAFMREHHSEYLREEYRTAPIEES